MKAITLVIISLFVIYICKNFVARSCILVHVFALDQKFLLEKQEKLEVNKFL